MHTDDGTAFVSSAALLERINGISEAAKHVVVCHGSFLQLSSSLRRVGSLLHDAFEASQLNASLVNGTFRRLDNILKNAKELITHCMITGKFYLLLNCHAYAKCIKVVLSSLASVLLNLTSDIVDLPLEMRNRIKLVCIYMQAIQVRVSLEEEDLFKTAELAVSNCYVDAKHANELLYKLASVAGISLEQSSLRREYNELRREKEAITAHQNDDNTLRLNQIISLLSYADALSSVTAESQQQYHKQRFRINNDPLPPLRTFYCPITLDVMENPVEIESGHTFEMSAIQRWFADGHRVCPVSKMEIQSLVLKPNRLLRQSIEEWEDRNTVIKLAAVTDRLNSGSEELVIEALLEIQSICEGKSVHKCWIAAEGLIPILVGILGSSKRELKKKTLETLTILVADNCENRAKVCEAGATEHAVCSLARDAGEAKLAVDFLLELCKEDRLWRMISKVQGCILLLVMLASRDNAPSASKAKELLRLFAKEDNNVVQMAEVNYFQHLLECLQKGSQSTQMLMANTLSRMQLSDPSRALLVQEGVIPSLIRLASGRNLEGKCAALGALCNLSYLRDNGHAIIEGGAMKTVLEVLLRVESTSASIREHAAATFANLVMSSEPTHLNNLWGTEIERGQFICELISLLDLTGPNIQSHILKALDLIYNGDVASAFRETLKERKSIASLSHFMDAKDCQVRLYALKVLHTLTMDGGGHIMAEEMAFKAYTDLVELFGSNASQEEKAAAMGILGNLPLHNRQVTERMLQAGVLSSIVSILEKFSSGHSVKANVALVENALWTLVRFTLPTDIQIQLYTARHGIIPILVNLINTSLPVIKARAVMSLQQLSENTSTLSVPVKNSAGCWRCFASRSQPGCTVHCGICSIEGTFCLLEANAVLPLVRSLEDADDDLDEAALGAMSTLVRGDGWERGSDVLVDSGGMKLIIKKLSSVNAGVQEKALLVLEKILKREKYKARFGNMVQMPLVSRHREERI